MTYRVSLRFLCDIILVNHPIKHDTKIICTVETYMTKLFKSNEKIAAIAAPGGQILWHYAPFIQ